MRNLHRDYFLRTLFRCLFDFHLEFRVRIAYVISLYED